MVQVLRLEKGHCIKSTCLIENTHVQNRRNCLRENVKNAHVLLYIQIYKPSCNAGSTMSNSKLNTFLQTMQFSTDNYSAPSIRIINSLPLPMKVAKLCVDFRELKKN